MKKKFIYPLIAFIASFLAIVMTGIFVTWDPDFSKWVAADRFLLISLGFIVSTFFTFIVRDMLK